MPEGRFGNSTTRLAGKIEYDKLEISQMYLKGIPQYKMGEVLDISPATVSRELKKIRQMWVEQTVTNFSEIKAMELAKIEAVEREAWAAWERSQEEFVKVSTSKVGKEGKEETITITKTQQVGDGKFLALMLKCIAQRCAIFGVDTPGKLDWKKELPSGIAVEEMENTFTAILRTIAQSGDIQEVEVSRTLKQTQHKAGDDDSIEGVYNVSDD